MNRSCPLVLGPVCDAGRAVSDVAGKGRGVDLMPQRQFVRDTLGLVAALGIHDSDMHALLRQRVTDALPEPAVAARHQRDRASEVHQFSPARGGTALSQRRSSGQFGAQPGNRQAIGREKQGN